MMALLGVTVAMSPMLNPGDDKVDKTTTHVDDALPPFPGDDHQNIDHEKALNSENEGSDSSDSEEESDSVDNNFDVNFEDVDELDMLLKEILGEKEEINERYQKVVLELKKRIKILNNPQTPAGYSKKTKVFGFAAVSAITYYLYSSGFVTSIVNGAKNLILS